MVEANGWHAARLIPATGIDGAEEQERRATSALLSVMGAVPAFGRALTEPLGAPSGPVETYVDVPLSIGAEPFAAAGVVRVHHAPDVWTALVDVRAGDRTGGARRLEDCLDAAAEQGFDAVVTVGGEPPPESPAGSVAVRHLAWARVVAEAVRLRDTISDPARAWILRELVRYLEHPASGVSAALDEAPVIEKAPATPVVPADTRITDLTRGPRVVDLTKLMSPEPVAEPVPPASPPPPPPPPIAEPERPPAPVAEPAVLERTPLPPVPVITTPVRSVLRELLAASDGAPPTAETPKISLPAAWEAPTGDHDTPAAVGRGSAVRPPHPNGTAGAAEPPTLAMPAPEPQPEPAPDPAPPAMPVPPPAPLPVSAPEPGSSAPSTAGIPVTDPALRPTRGPSRREIRLARTLDALDDHEPGWFLDPGDDAKLRWWSGAAWGTTTYALQRVEPPAPTRGRTHDAALTTRP